MDWDALSRPDKWIVARLMHEEDGDTLVKVASYVGVSKQAVHQRKKKEGWVGKFDN